MPGNRALAGVEIFRKPDSCVFPDPTVFQPEDPTVFGPQFIGLGGNDAANARSDSSPPLPLPGSIEGPADRSGVTLPPPAVSIAASTGEEYTVAWLGNMEPRSNVWIIQASSLSVGEESRNDSHWLGVVLPAAYLN
jgi:hypothetical protein